MILMEMDDFGGVNESYGREVGDELLHHVATVITHSVRTTDLAARYGGLEFAMLLPPRFDGLGTAAVIAAFTAPVAFLQKSAFAAYLDARGTPE